MRVSVLVTLLACCAVAHGIGLPNVNIPNSDVNDVLNNVNDVLKDVISEGLPNNRPNIPDVISEGPPTNRPNIPDSLPDIPSFIPGFGEQRTCSSTLSIAAYINCCGPQDNCDASKITNNLKPEKLEQVSCQAVSKGVSSRTQLDSLLSGLSSKSSSCLSSAIGDSFQKFHGSVSEWNLDTFKQLPEEALSNFNISSLKKVPRSIYQDKTGLKKMGDALGEMTEDQISSMLPNLEDALGEFPQWDGDKLKNTLTQAPKYVCGMSSKDTSRMKPAAVADSIHEVASAVKGCSNKAHSKDIARGFVRRFEEQHGDIGTWSGTVLNSLDDLKSELNTADLQKLGARALSDANTLPKADEIFSAKQKQAIAEAVRKFVPGTVDNDVVMKVLKNVSSLLTSLRDSDIDKANCSLVGKYFLQSASRKVSVQSLKTVAQKVKKCGLQQIQAADSATFSGAQTFEDFMKSDISSIAPYLAGFSTDDIDKLKLKDAFSDLQSNVDTTLSDALSDVQGHKIAAKLIEGTSRVNLDRMHKLGKYLTAHDVSSVAMAFNLDEIKNATAKGLRVAKDVASQFAETALAALGNDFSDADSFPSNTIFNDLGENIVKGFNRTTFRNLPQDGLDGFVSSAAKFDLSAGQVQEMAKRYSEDLVMTFDEQMVRGLGQVVAHFNTSLISSLGAAGKAQVARNLGQARKLLGFAGDKKRVEDLASKADKWLRPNGEAVTYEHVHNLGSLVNFLPPSFANGLSNDDLKAAAGQLSQTPAGEAVEDTRTRLQDVAQVVHRKLKDAKNGLDKDVVKNLGQAACHLPDAFFNSINSQAKFDAISDTLGSAGCDKDSMAAKTIVEKAKMYHTGDTNKARDLGPSILRTMNKSLPAMSMDDLKDLPADTIKDSLETFGQAGFSRDQARELVNKIAPGSAEGFTARRRRQSESQSNLSLSQIQSLGSLACGFKPTSLAPFLSDIDSMCSLSKQRCYTDAQKSSILTELKKTGAIPGMRAEVLSCLGEFATHMSVSDVTGIGAQKFKRVANSLGKRMYGRDDLKKALGKAATDSFGDNVGSWPAGIVQSLGNLTGYLGVDDSAMGCSVQKVQSMTADQIGTIDPSVIPNMQNLKCMSMEQLKAFDGEQARAVTPAQVSRLTSSQQTVIAEMSCNPECTVAAVESGATSITATFMVVATAMLVAALF